MTAPRQTSSWLPTDAQVRAAIERQRAEALRHGSRMAGPESVYVDPRMARQHLRPARPTWWRRAWNALIGLTRSCP
jgi:hypothetical protein